VQRIFLSLAVFAVLLLVANVLVGLSGGDYNGPVHAYVDEAQKMRELEKTKAPREAIQQIKDRQTELYREVKQLQPHMLWHESLGIGSALITLLVCSVSITYFVGTSRWFKEVVETYHLNPEFVEQSARIKRRSFRWSVAGALTILAVVGLGAAAEPTLANAQFSQSYVTPHYVAALAAVAFLLLSFYMQWLSLTENGKLIETVMGDVRRIRTERGLAVEEPQQS
jgi:hypothetical protein